MKRIFFLTLASLCGLGSLHADLTVVQKIDGMGNMLVESTTKIKGTKTRVDAMAGMSMIMNSDTGDILNLMHAQKSFMKIPAEAAKQAVAKMAGAESAAKPKLVATGKKETINTYPSEEYTCEVAGHKMFVWLSTALPNYKVALKEMTAAMGHGPMASAMQGLSLYSEDLPGFPIRTVTEIAPGQTLTSTTTSLDTKPVADSEFVVPAGYKEMALPMLTPPAAAGTPTAPVAPVPAATPHP